MFPWMQVSYLLEYTNRVNYYRLKTKDERRFFLLICTCHVKALRWVTLFVTNINKSVVSPVFL